MRSVGPIFSRRSDERIDAVLSNDGFHAHAVARYKGQHLGFPILLDLPIQLLSVSDSPLPPQALS